MDVDWTRGVASAQFIQLPAVEQTSVRRLPLLPLPAGFELRDIGGAR